MPIIWRIVSTSRLRPPSAISRSMIGSGVGIGLDGAEEGAQVARRAARRRGAGAVVASSAARGDRGEALGEHVAVEAELALEVVVDHRLVDAGPARDAVDAGAGEAAGGELDPGGAEDVAAGVTVAGAGGPGHLIN